jgi:hypothetical protein
VFVAAVCAVPILVAIGAVALDERRFVRSSALVIVCLVFVAGMTGLVAAHRLADEISATRPHGPEWERGVEDMRNVIGSLLPILGASFAGATILSLGRITSRRKQ